MRKEEERRIGVERQESREYCDGMVQKVLRIIPKYLLVYIIRLLYKNKIASLTNYNHLVYTVLAKSMINICTVFVT